MGNPSVLRRTQIGIESVFGTRVNANKRLMCTQFNHKPMPRVTGHRSPGMKAQSYFTQAKPHTGFRIDADSIGFEDLAYLLSSVMRNPTGTFSYDITPDAADTFKSFSVEVGSGVRAERFQGAVVSDLELTFNLTQASLSGNGFGIGPPEQGITLTGSPTKLAAVAISPKNHKVYVGDSLGGLAQITRPLEVKFGIRGRFKPQFFMNNDASITEALERAPEVSASLILENDSVGAGYMADLASSAQKFLRVVAAGPSPYNFQLTFPFVFMDNDPGDQEDDYAYSYNLGVDVESSLGSFAAIDLVTSLGGL